MKIPFLVFCTLFFSTTGHAEPPSSNESSSVVAVLPQVISNPAARYPKKLLRECVGGKVTFKVTVREDGKIEDVKIIQSPNEQLSLAVIDTVKKQWLFTPYSNQDPNKLAIVQSYMSFFPEC